MTTQGPKERLVEYVKRFRNLDLNCYESKSEEEHIRNMVNNQRMFLENLPS